MTFNFIKYPLFMSRKKKVKILDGMISALEKSGKEKVCFKCKIPFEDWMSRWNSSGFNHSYCMLCHVEILGMKRKDFIMENEKREFTRLKNKRRKTSDLN